MNGAYGRPLRAAAELGDRLELLALCLVVALALGIIVWAIREAARK